MSDASPRSEWRALARALDDERPSADLRRRVLEAARPPSRSAGLRWRIPLAAFAAGVVITWLWLGSRAAQFSSPALPPPADHGGVAAVVPAAPDPDALGCGAHVNAEASAVPAPCRIELSEIGVVVDVWEPARLSRAGRTIAMLEGAATFEVQPVGDELPIEVDVGGGRVRVLGTRFEIQNTGAMGHLDLIRGRVEFHALDGEVRDVSPGQRLSWPRGPQPPVPDHHATTHSTSPERPPQPIDRPRGPAAHPAERDRAGTPVDLDATLEHVARLRHSGAYDEAEALLRAAMKGVGERHTEEVLSFEIGTLLELETDRDAACAHWSAHVERFADGTTSARARAHRQRLECEPG